MSDNNGQGGVKTYTPSSATSQSSSDKSAGEAPALAKNIICIASGKGGVGKSTTAVNLALALQNIGLKVGLLDADIYGPSQPLMLGIPVGTKPKIRDQKFMEPVIAHGLQCNSMGLLVDPRTAMAWRAPMIVGAFNQILKDTLWLGLDYLIVDMPPGTGDIQLSLSQNVAVTGAVIVTTPQDVALLDAFKGIEMFNKVNVPILGIVENMSTHICSECGHEEAIFGSGGADRLAEDYQVSVIGRLPLELQVRSTTDAGTPIVVAQPEHPASVAYAALAQELVAAVHGVTLAAATAPMPKISITDD